MEGQETDNQTQQQVSPDNNGESSLSNLLGGMADKAPETKPDTNVGDKDEGEKTSADTDTEIPAWISQLPEELRSNADSMKQFAKFKKIGDLAKSYSELESKLGSSLIKPGDDSTDEERSAFYEKLGRPKSADGYSFANDENAKPFLELAFKNNLTEAQAKSLYESFNEMNQQIVKDQAQRIVQGAKETEDKLRAEYGSKYSEKLTMLERGIMAYGGPAMAKKLQNAGLLFDESFARMFIQLGEMNAEGGTFSKGAGAGNSYKSTADGGSFEFKGLGL